MKVKVYINRHVIAANRKSGASEPPISVSKGRKLIRAHSVDLIGPARVVYAPDRPLACGATVYIEAFDATVHELPAILQETAASCRRGGGVRRKAYDK